MVSPDGQETRLIHGRTQFGKEIGATFHEFKRCVYDGATKHVKGWALPETPRTVIYGPDGKQYSFVSKIMFRRMHGPIDVQGLLNGEKICSRGWSLDPSRVNYQMPPKPPKPPRVLGYVHPPKPVTLTNGIETRTFASRGDALRQLQMDKRTLYKLFSGEKQSVKGWRLAPS